MTKHIKLNTKSVALVKEGVAFQIRINDQIRALKQSMEELQGMAGDKAHEVFKAVAKEEGLPFCGLDMSYLNDHGLVMGKVCACKLAEEQPGTKCDIMDTNDLVATDAETGTVRKIH